MGDPGLGGPSSGQEVTAPHAAAPTNTTTAPGHEPPLKSLEASIYARQATFTAVRAQGKGAAGPQGLGVQALGVGLNDVMEPPICILVGGCVMFSLAPGAGNSKPRDTTTQPKLTST